MDISLVVGEEDGGEGDAEGGTVRNLKRVKGKNSPKVVEKKMEMLGVLAKGSEYILNALARIEVGFKL